MTKFLSRYWMLLVLFLIAVPALYPTIQPKFFSVHDEAQHILDIYQMYRSLSLGNFPPRFAPDINFGMGHPYFNFYYHLPFYLTSAFIFLGFSLTAAFKMFMTLVIVSAIFGFYFFMSRFVGMVSSILAATLYLYTPYFAVDLYVRGAFGELAILAVMPWVAWSISRLIQNPKLINLCISAVLIALLSLSHNTLHIFIFPLLFSFGLLLALSSKTLVRKKLMLLFLAFFMGIAIASYYLLPALIERQFISDYEQFNMADHFPFIKQLLIPSWGYGISIWGPLDGMSFQIGLLHLLVIFLALITLKFIKEKKLVIFCLITLAISIILMNSRTYPLWNINILFHFIQFPWRLLLIITFLTPILAGFVFNIYFERIDKRRSLIYLGLGILVIMLFYVWYFKPSSYKEVSDERYLELYFANRTTIGERGYLSKEYLNFAEDSIPPTIWQKSRPKDLPSSLVTSEFPANLEYQQSGLDFNIMIDSKTENSIRVFKVYFPGWVAYIDKKGVSPSPFSDLGIIAFQVPPGSHSVELKFEDTLVRRISNLLSLSAALILLGLTLRGLKFKR